jgi:hypothetical protein
MTSATSGQARLVLVLLAVLLVGMATPSVAGPVAAKARNADKVDGLSAVKSTASLKKRRGKLVATDKKTGLLPNDIIAKAPDADRLDGLDSTGLVQKAAVAHQRTVCASVAFLSTADEGYGTLADGMRYLSGAAGTVACGLDLPVGATIRAFSVNVWDGSLADNITCALHRVAFNPITGGGDTILGSGTSDNTALNFFTIRDDTITTPLVDATHGYDVRCSLVGGGPGHGVYGADVTFDVPVSSLLNQ